MLNFISCFLPASAAACAAYHRYFTAPFALAVLHIPAPRKLQSMVTAAAFVFVNAVTLYVFVAKPYTWGDGSIARFMW